MTLVVHSAGLGVAEPKHCAIPMSMASSNLAAGKKRPVPSNGSRFNDSKRRKTDIPTQNAPRELNIAGFVKAREFEIKALENSMAKARKGLMSRAFQQVPRNMRRRTASHNVKKVPRRLRRRAVREVRKPLHLGDASVLTELTSTSVDESRQHTDSEQTE